MVDDSRGALPSPCRLQPGLPVPPMPPLFTPTRLSADTVASGLGSGPLPVAAPLILGLSCLHLALATVHSEFST